MEQIHPKQRFLLMEGGPLYHIEKRVGLMEQNAPRTKHRAILAILITWVPLLIFALIRGTAYGHDVAVPFLRDFSIYTRFLLAVPLLLLAEAVLGPRIAEAAEEFIKSGIVTEKDYDSFDAAVEKGLKSRDSVVAEVVLLVLSYAGAVLSFMTLSVHTSTWYETRTDNAMSITLAKFWLIFVCAPILQFLTLRWMWRLFLWFRFLAQVRAMDIRLIPTHPDHTGGLGFVGMAQKFFGILLVAYSTMLVGVMANEVVYGKVSLQSLAPAIGLYVLMAVGIIVGPLVLFSKKLRKTKRLGLYSYGALASQYTYAFHRKWIYGENPAEEPLLGTGDIQSLADLANSFAVIEKMIPFPIEPKTVIQLVVIGLLPMVPLLLTVMPLKEVLELLAKVLVV